VLLPVYGDGVFDVAGKTIENRPVHAVLGEGT